MNLPTFLPRRNNDPSTFSNQPIYWLCSNWLINKDEMINFWLTLRQYKKAIAQLNPPLQFQWRKDIAVEYDRDLGKWFIRKRETK